MSQVLGIIERNDDGEYSSIHLFDEELHRYSYVEIPPTVLEQEKIRWAIDWMTKKGVTQIVDEGDKYPFMIYLFVHWREVVLR